MERMFIGDLRSVQRDFSLAGTARKAIIRSFRMPPPRWYKIKLIYLRGESVSTVQSWIQSTWERVIKPAIYHGSFEAAWRFREAGMRQVLLTGTPRPLAEPLAQLLHITDIIAAEPEIKNSIYTGGLLRPHPRSYRKERYASAWLGENGASWDQVVALANTWQDRYVLSKAETAVAVKPDSRLRHMATDRKWLIVEDPSGPDAFQEVTERLTRSG
jgi:phosphoserine phosphatase